MDKVSSSSEDQLRFDRLKLDQLIDEVNEQIELLAFDSPEPALLRQLVRGLADSRSATRFGIIEIFSQIGELATPFLLEALAASSDASVRRACCNALTNIGDPDSVVGLVTALLNDPDQGVKSAAAAALAKVGVPAFDALRQVLTSATTDESCKGHAAWAIASMSREVSEQLYALMDDASATVRTAAVGAIAQLVQKPIEPDSAQADPDPPSGGEDNQTHKALSALTQALNDPSSEVKIEAAANLARLNHQLAYQPLLHCLQDPHGEVRAAAMMALAKLGNPDAIEAISPLQQDGDPSVKRVAQLVFQQLSSDQIFRERLSMNGLSDRAQQLIPQARIMNFVGWPGLEAEAIALLQTADDDKQYLTDEDLAIITNVSPDASSGTSPDAAQLTPALVVKQLRDQAADIVDEARSEVLQAFPGILEPGGGLYPAMRAEACWRDFWHFLRCITYAIAGANSQYTSAEGLAAMEKLYEELQVPLPAMLEGLKSIKKASLSRFPGETHADLEPYFDHLTEQLASFRS